MKMLTSSHKIRGTFRKHTHTAVNWKQRKYINKVARRSPISTVSGRDETFNI